MKKTIIFFACILVSFSVVPFFGCRKFTPEHPVCPPPAETTCLISQIIFTLDQRTDTINFGYNAAGNPVSAFRTRQFDASGQLSYYWRYDVSGKLTDMVWLYGHDTVNFSGVQQWDRLYYDANDNIVLDTMYITPWVANRHVNGSPLAVGVLTYQYDTAHRVVRKIGVQSGNTLEDITYTYNAEGNILGKPYDDKVSMYSGSKLWQWLGLDYSKNNPLDWNSWTSYNQYGYPTSFADIYTQNYRLLKNSGFDGISMQSAIISYTCDAPAAPAGKAY